MHSGREARVDRGGRTLIGNAGFRDFRFRHPRIDVAGAVNLFQGALFHPSFSMAPTVRIIPGAASLVKIFVRVFSLLATMQTQPEALRGMMLSPLALLLDRYLPPSPSPRNWVSRRLAVRESRCFSACGSRIRVHFGGDEVEDDGGFLVR